MHRSSCSSIVQLRSGVLKSDDQNGLKGLSCMPPPPRAGPLEEIKAGPEGEEIHMDPRPASLPRPPGDQDLTDS